MKNTFSYIMHMVKRSRIKMIWVILNFEFSLKKDFGQVLRNQSYVKSC
jgi:hypothetical protein